MDVTLSRPTVQDPYKYKYFLIKTPDSYWLSPDMPSINDTSGCYIKYGDVDGNNYITSNDCTWIQQKINNPSFNIGVKGEIAADVDGDGSITSTDVTHVMQKVLTSSYQLPIINKFNQIYN